MRRNDILTRISIRLMVMSLVIFSIVGLLDQLAPLGSTVQADTTSFPAGVQSPRSSDATLSTLSLSGTVSRHPSFSAATMSYVAQVGIDMSETTVTATANHWTASVDIERRTSFGAWMDANGGVPLE